MYERMRINKYNNNFYVGKMEIRKMANQKLTWAYSVLYLKKTTERRNI